MIIERLVGFTPRGLGFFGRLVRKDDYVMMSDGACLFIDHNFIGSYYKNVLGIYNEHETYLYLQTTFKHFGTCTFIDVGANVGEMTVQAYHDPHVRIIHVIEPNPNCLLIIKKAIERMGETTKQINYHPFFLADMDGKINIDSNNKRTRDLSLFENAAGKHEVGIATLDSLECKVVGKLIIKIDVEGAESKVVKGASEIITEHSPIIIFEYNEKSRDYFKLNEMSALLPDYYKIKRLNSDGVLDDDLTKTYNCVAIPFSD